MNSLMKRTNGHVPAATFSGMVDKFFQNNVGRFFDDGFWGFNGVERATSVPVNIRETDKAYYLELVAPGLKKEDFKVSLGNDMLTVSFEQREEQSKQNESEGWLRKEYRHRSFSRSFSLDDTLDAGKINAAYRDGILHLEIPKKEGAQTVSRTIAVQ